MRVSRIAITERGELYRLGRFEKMGNVIIERLYGLEVANVGRRSLVRINNVRPRFAFNDDADLKAPKEFKSRLQIRSEKRILLSSGRGRENEMPWEVEGSRVPADGGALGQVPQALLHAA